MDPFITSLLAMAGSYAPYGWSTCNGQVMPISQNTAMFSLMGTMYGGNGKSNFQLPNLAYATPIGTGASVTDEVRVDEGEFFDELYGAWNDGHQPLAAVGAQAISTADAPVVNAAGTPATDAEGQPTGEKIAAGAVKSAVIGQQTGLNASVNGVGVIWCIALQGIFPTRDW